MSEWRWWGYNFILIQEKVFLLTLSNVLYFICINNYEFASKEYCYV